MQHREHRGGFRHSTYLPPPPFSSLFPFPPKKKRRLGPKYDDFQRSAVPPFFFLFLCWFLPFFFRAGPMAKNGRARTAPTPDTNEQFPPFFFPFPSTVPFPPHPGCPSSKIRLDRRFDNRRKTRTAAGLFPFFAENFLFFPSRPPRSLLPPALGEVGGRRKQVPPFFFSLFSFSRPFSPLFFFSTVAARRKDRGKSYPPSFPSFLFFFFFLALFPPFPPLFEGQGESTTASLAADVSPAPTLRLSLFPFSFPPPRFFSPLPSFLIRRRRGASELVARKSRIKMLPFESPFSSLSATPLFSLFPSYPAEGLGNGKIGETGRSRPLPPPSFSSG